MQGIVVDTQRKLMDNNLGNVLKSIGIEEIRQARKKRLVIIVLSVFGDESHDEKEQRVFAVSGIAGTQEEWDELAVLWNQRTGGKPFHAADCEAGQGEYKGISRKERLKLYRQLVNLLIATKLMGFVKAIDLQGWRTYFPGNLDTIPYDLCFLEVVMLFAGMAYKSVPREKVNFTFDLNNRTNPSTAVFYEWMTSLPEWEWKYAPCLVHTISFAPRTESIGIQAADIFAREAMKHYDNFFIGPRKYRFERKSLQELRATGRYKVLFFTKGYFEDWKNKYSLLEEKAGVTGSDYAQWLLQKKLNNNPVNRFKFLMYFDSLNKVKRNETS